MDNWEYNYGKLKDWMHHVVEGYEQTLRENEELRTENKRLRSALTWIAGASTNQGEVVNLPECVQLFAAINRQAKEATQQAQQEQARD